MNNKRKRSVSDNENNDDDEDIDKLIINKKNKLNYTKEEISSVIIIQSFFRQKCIYFNYIEEWDIFTQLYEKKTFVNDSTFLGNKFNSIKKKYRYALLENSKWYAFDIRELYKYLQTDSKNPYTNQIIPYYKLKQIFRICRNLIQNGSSLIIKNPIPKASKDTVWFSKFIDKLNTYETYISLTQLKKLHSSQMFIILSRLLIQYNCIYAIKELYDFFQDNSTNAGLKYMINVIYDIYECNPEFEETISYTISDMINGFEKSNDEYRTAECLDWDVSFVSFMRMEPS